MTTTVRSLFWSLAEVTYQLLREGLITSWSADYVKEVAIICGPQMGQIMVQVTPLVLDGESYYKINSLESDGSSIYVPTGGENELKRLDVVLRDTVKRH